MVLLTALGTCGLSYFGCLQLGVGQDQPSIHMPLEQVPPSSSPWPPHPRDIFNATSPGGVTGPIASGESVEAFVVPSDRDLVITSYNGNGVAWNIVAEKDEARQVLLYQKAVPLRSRWYTDGPIGLSVAKGSAVLLELEWHTSLSSPSWSVVGYLYPPTDAPIEWPPRPKNIVTLTGEHVFAPYEQHGVYTVPSKKWLVVTFVEPFAPGSDVTTNPLNGVVTIIEEKDGVQVAKTAELPIDLNHQDTNEARNHGPLGLTFRPGSRVVIANDGYGSSPNPPGDGLLRWIANGYIVPDH